MPADPLAQALTLAARGDLAQAMHAVEAALAVAPDNPAALGLKAALLNERGEWAAALPLFERAVTGDTRNAGLHANRGAALAKAGRLEEALKSYDQALTVNPDHVPALCNRAALRIDMGHFDEALQDALRATRLAPSLAAAHMQRARALQGLGRLEEAAAAFSAVIALRPDHPQAHHGLGLARHGQMRFAEALESLERALELRPDDAEILRQRGMTLLNLRRREAALESLDAACALRPDGMQAQVDRSVVLAALGRYDEALAALDAAIAAAPEAPLPRLRRSQALLRRGQFATGWREHEHRWREPAFIAKSSGYVTAAARARFDPAVTREDLRGNRVLAIAEQGVGDQIMFASMLPDLARDAAEVTCLWDPRLNALGDSLRGIRFVGPTPYPDLTAFDHVLALGSLGRLYRSEAADFPARPFLAPRESVIAAWRERLGPGPTRLRIGLSWRGGAPSTSGAWRSLALEDLGPLLRREDCSFVSLQYGDTQAEVAAANAGLERPIVRFAAGEIDDFEQLAGLVRSLDLVISVQTALIHLCGAIGAPCRVLVPFAPEWRYGEAGAAMPWYGSVQLYRQTRPDDWDGVIKAVMATLDR
jgi:tetratricopeptide (TPR) repeat protein